MNMIVGPRSWFLGLKVLGPRILGSAVPGPGVLGHKSWVPNHEGPWSRALILDYVILLHTKKSGQKFNYLENKKAWRWNKKHVSSFLKDFQLPKIVSNLRVDYSNV